MSQGPTVGIRRPSPAYGASGGLTNEIQLNRGDELLILDRERQDQQDKILEQSQTIRGLQNHIIYLERQLQRAIALNPSMADDLNRGEAPAAAEDKGIDEQANQLASLIQNSTLLRSYEQLMQEFEADNDRKGKHIDKLERDYQQLLSENNVMSQELYQFKSKVFAGTDDRQAANLTPDLGQNATEFDVADRVQKDKMVELLKRNHDVMMEKYETYRARNDALEKKALEKENLYVVIKADNDKLSNQVYSFRREVSELQQERQLLQSKFTSADSQLKTANEKAQSLQQKSEQQEGQLKVVSEQLDLVQRSHDQLAAKKQNEIDLLTKEVNLQGVKQRDVKSQLIHFERELGEHKDQLRQVTSELETRTKENDHLVSLLEDQEQRIALYEEKEKSIQQLASESKKRIEDANLERDRVLLKEQQYLTRVSRLEEQLNKEAKEHQERHERVIESLRLKHKTLLDQKTDELADLNRKLSDANENAERFRMDRDSLREEVAKLQDQWRTFKEDTSMKYENYSKQINQQEAMSEEKIRGCQRENDKLKEELEAIKNERTQAAILQHEQEVKLDSYMRDYERYFDDNKRLRELINQLRDEKESAISELNRMKIVFHGRVNELNDECNVKVAHLENQLLESKERYKSYEERAYNVMIQQEKITEKWKDEHRNTVSYYDRSLKQLQIENRHLSDKVIELKGQIKAMRGDTVYEQSKIGSGAPAGQSSKRTSSKSRDRK